MNEEIKLEQHEAWRARVFPDVPKPSPRVRGGRGTLVVDNRAAGGEKLEMPTLSCAHCNTVVILNPLRRRERGYCRKCHAYVCDVCNGKECRPLNQGIELSLKDPTLTPFAVDDYSLYRMNDAIQKARIY